MYYDESSFQYECCLVEIDGLIKDLTKNQHKLVFKADKATFHELLAIYKDTCKKYDDGFQDDGNMYTMYEKIEYLQTLCDNYDALDKEDHERLVSTVQWITSRDI